MSAERHIKRIYLSAEADFAVSDILSMYSGVVPTPLPPVFAARRARRLACRYADAVARRQVIYLR